ncbi:hypothetical protein HBI81_096810 [Parastagonospora nodorum]|nr:hypothetical protein HBI09_227090 [Parastagonospora nodorum]KAH4105291.1 hypothetical protein HBH46_085420 [Parastagonospora nodorum]KAH4169966.1 hypothetical protein HBH43_113200 [Parastagonospora nodorum]KAH4188785.1 hypothetical protein HBI95_230100 [Parastagonospora nodorum]KAH4233599.1 hypothetical protein HBI06_071820 [Parastagonospora nodorum]
MSLSIPDLFSVKDLVAVVTGGGTGIGLMIAKALEHNGAIVYILGRREEVLQDACKQAKFSKIQYIVADVTDKASLQHAVDVIQDEVGYINLLVNNSGTIGRRHSSLPRPPPFPPLPKDFVASEPDSNFTTIRGIREFLWKDEPSNWSHVFSVNVTGVWLTSVAFLELLDAGNKRQNFPAKSQIVTVGSIGAFLRLVGGTSYSYNPSKAAATQLAKMFASNFVHWGIRANVIAPGVYPSEISAGVDNLDDKNSSRRPPKIPASEIPLERFGGEQDMASAILYLASSGGGYLNGCTIVTDGGRLGAFPSVA